MASNLLSIPAELLASIADELEANDYGSLRLCCKQAEDYTFPYFAKKFFSRRKFFRGYFSLSTLLSISQSRFSPYLETFVLSTVLISGKVDNELSALTRDAYLQAYAEQTSILASGWDRDTLIAAFGNLPNLGQIAVEAFDDDETWDTDGQLTSTYDGGYGLRTLLGNMGFGQGRPPHQASVTYQFVVSVQTLLTAVAKAEVRPKVLSIRGRTVSPYDPTGLGVDDYAFNIPAFLRQMILPVIEGLEELDIDIYLPCEYPPPDLSSTCRTSHLREFLGLPKRLQRLRIRHLRVGQVDLDGAEQQDDFWIWLGTGYKGKGKVAAGQQGADAGDTALPSPDPIAFPDLQDLELSDQEVPLADLMHILEKVSPTLRRLTLNDLVLRDSQLPVPDEEDSVKDEAELWAGLCGKLAALPCEGLHEVNISGFGGLGDWYLEHFGDTLAEPDSVHFKELRITEDSSLSRDRARAEFSHKGPGVRKALRQLADDIRAALRDGRHVFNAAPVGRRNSF